MKPRRVQVSHTEKNGFVLTVEEYSRFRSFVASAADKLCTLTGDRFCHFLTSWPITWDWEGSTELLRVPIGRTEADKLKYREDDWTWLDETDVVSVN